MPDAHHLDTLVAKLLDRERAHDHTQAEEATHAAVAAILRDPPAGGGAELFFIQRADHPTDPWSGHIAFPGGRKDASDASLLDTAIRETREEVGLDLRRAELVTRLPDVPAFLRSRRGGLVVTPYVFALRGASDPFPNEEVAATLWVPFSSLARGEGRGTHSFVWEDKSYDVPCIRLEPGKKVLWGMTYRMLETMLEALGITPSS